MRIAATASIVCVLLPASCLYADSILSTYCRVDLPDGGVSEINSTAGCSFVLPIPPFTYPASAEASANSAYEFVAFDRFPAGTFWASVGVSTAANHPPFDRDLSIYPEFSTAQASAQLSFQAATAGPVRPGLVDLTYSFGYGCEGNADIQAEARIGDVFVEYLDPGCPGFGRTAAGTYPFTLGQPFDIQLSTLAQSWGNFHSGGDSGGSFEAFIYLRELDGTPVDLLLDSQPPAAVPEPSTLWLLATAMALLSLRRAIGRRVRKTQ
jgi:PEP-CTERM motif